MEPLQPWTGPDESEPEETGSGGYLLMAGVVCGLIIAIGSQAIQGHFAKDPALAQADPWMVSVIAGARWAGAVLAGASLAAWLWTLAQKAKKA